MPETTSPDVYQRSGNNSAISTLWDIAGRTLSVRDTEGVTGTQGTNQAAAINAAINDAADRYSSSTLYVPDGTYDVETPIVPKNGVRLVLSPNAVMRCVAPMPAMVQTPADQCLFDGGIEGGRWLCGDNADGGFDLQWFQRFKVFHNYIDRYRFFAVRAGLAGTAYSSFECEIFDLNTFRSAGAVAGSSKAVHFRTATDSTIMKSILCGAESGFYGESGGHHLYNVHSWSPGARGNMKVGFWDKAGSTTYVDCYADTPTEDGFRLEYGLNTLVACRSFINQLYDSGGAVIPNDGAANGVKFYTPEPNSSIRDFKCGGFSSSFRHLADIDTSSVTVDGSVEITGTMTNQTINVCPTIYRSSGVVERKISGTTHAIPGTEVSIAHLCKKPDGTGRVPRVINVVPKAAGMIYMSSAVDATNVYLSSSATSQPFDLYVG